MLRHQGKVSRHSRSWRELLPKVQKEAKPPEDRREFLDLMGGFWGRGPGLPSDDVVFGYVICLG